MVDRLGHYGGRIIILSSRPSTAAAPPQFRGSRIHNNGALFTIRILGRIVIVCVDHCFAGFTDTNGPRLTEPRARNQKRALGIEDLTASATVVFSAKCGECLSTVEAVLGIFIAHPEISTKQPISELR